LHQGKDRESSLFEKCSKFPCCKNMPRVKRISREFFVMHVRVCKCRSFKYQNLKTACSDRSLFIVPRPFFFLPKHNVSNISCFPFFRCLVEIRNSVPLGYSAHLAQNAFSTERTEPISETLCSE